MKRLLVTAALPYANGSIHLGHLVEYIQTDIWVRYWKLRARDAAYLCADDAHGTAVMLRAQAEGISPETLIDRVWQEHRRDFADFDIAFDCYHTTHSEENRALSAETYERLLAEGHIVEKEIEQAYCPSCCLFLPDRYIRGICPACGARDQYGDVCEVCASSHTPADLLEPHCAQCGSAPERRATSHLFFRLTDFECQLKDWVRGDHVPAEVEHKMNEWFATGLRDWDITRDAPYFGFEIPDRPGQYFYVWLDAPVGYMAATQHWCQETGRDFDSYWKSESESEVYHFIGKDITYFHALFWPAMLMGAGFRTPTGLCVHGFLTVNGEKMSKSRGTFVTARNYLRCLDPVYLRYYYATKLSPRVDDIDLAPGDFINRVNSELVGKIANIPSRTLSILHGSCDSRLGEVDVEGRRLIEAIAARRDQIAELYEARELHLVTRSLLEAAAEINTYLEAQAPWQTAKTDIDRARNTCTAALNAYKALATLLQPIVPRFGEKLADLLGLEMLRWDEIDKVLTDQPIKPYDRLVDRIRKEQVEEMFAGATIAGISA